MEDKKIENLIPELSDEALDLASGGGGNYYTDPYEKMCSHCSRRLTTDEEKRTGVCSYCWDDRIVERP